MNDSEMFDHDIAIIGMAGRFPGAKNIDEFWQNVQQGIETIAFFSEEEAIASGADPRFLQHPGHVNASGVLENIEYFDAAFFGYSPREAEMMDPQQRIFLECAWEALEHAGYDSKAYRGRIGVYAGSSNSSYVNRLFANRSFVEAVGIDQLLRGNEKDFLATRVSYKLDLRGPGIAIQTACSTSLVAVHLACQSLLNGECDMALAGGISIVVPQKAGYLYQEGGVSSPDGHCRAFSARAQGTVGGNGAGIVVLKPLGNALADGDSIFAVIKGSAINNDGDAKIGYMAPSVTGQMQVIVEAQAVAGIEPETITYIEAHGTGTPLGDPVEITALARAFQATTQKKGFCALGSVKTNIGHLDAAAGVVGLIKTVLALKHRILPPSLNFEEPNPKIDFANSPFYVNTRSVEWQAGSLPRRAGVSSFGIGGTNAHVVLEEAPAVKPADIAETARSWQLLLLSAKTSKALTAATENLLAHLKRYPDLSMADAAYTSQNGRRAFQHRQMIMCRNIEEAIATLETRDPQRLFSAVQESRNRAVVFMFPGSGAQYINMGLELYQQEPVFREQVDRCSELLRSHLELDLRTILYPVEQQAETAAQRLRKTSLAMPTLFVIDYALAKLWMSWGVQPQAMIGHSLGEYVAACLAGVFSLQDALALVAFRGRLLEQLPEGAMLSVPLSAQELQPLLKAGLSLAAINGPSLCVISGSKAAITAMEAELARSALEARRVQIDTALHSEMVTPILKPFTHFVEKIRLQAPQLPYISNVTGTWITAQEATSPDYWARHLRQTVRFSAGIQTLLQEPDGLLLEVGPGHTLSVLARQQVDHTHKPSIFPSLGYTRNPKSEMASLLTTVGQTWLAGVSIDWAAFAAHQPRQRIPLPTYPFERQYYWVESQQKITSTSPIEESRASNRECRLYMPSWKRVAPPTMPERENLALPKQCWLVFADTCGLAAQIVIALQNHGHQVITVTAGSQWSKVSNGSYTLDPRRVEDYEALFTASGALGRLPDGIVHCWGVSAGEGASGESKDLEMADYRSFSSLLFLAQALGKQQRTQPLEIVVISNNVQDVTGSERLSPQKASALGPCMVIPQEYPDIICRTIDIELPSSGIWQAKKLVDYLLAEIVTSSSDKVIAYRGNHRWVQAVEEVDQSPLDAKISRLQNEGTYLIIDGPGEMSLLLSESLARVLQARLVIIEPLSFPPRKAWEQWLTTHNEPTWIGQRIELVQALEALGAEVIVIQADMSHSASLQTVIDQAYAHCGTIHGIISSLGYVEDACLSTIRDIQPAEYEHYLRAKIGALSVLEQALQGKQFDFCLVCSPFSSSIGGKGGVIDIATSRLIDTFTYRHNQITPAAWRSVGWDNWQLNTAKEQQADIAAVFPELVLTPAEVSEALRALLATPVTRLLVLGGDFQIRRTAWLEHKSGPAKAQPAKEDTYTFHPRPDVQTTYIAPSNEIEKLIAVIWQELLGIERIGIHDHFFELGGHSLMASQLIARLREALLLEIPLHSIFESPTIAGLAAITEQLFIEKIEQLSEEEAERLISDTFQQGY